MSFASFHSFIFDHLLSFNNSLAFQAFAAGMLECFLQLDGVVLETTRPMATSEKSHQPGQSEATC